MTKIEAVNYLSIGSFKNCSEKIDIQFFDKKILE